MFVHFPDMLDCFFQSEYDPLFLFLFLSLFSLFLLQTSRSMIQYQFLSWPDHDVPYEAAGVLDLLERARNSQGAHTSPMLIHCRYTRTPTHTVVPLIIISWCEINVHEQLN